MPNHVKSFVRMQGIANEPLFAETGRGKEFDFSKLIPTPANDAAASNGWRLENWGTKWNAYETNVVNDDLISFVTAWNCPLPVFAALAQRYPERVIQVWYADEDAGRNANRFVFHDGSCDALNPTEEREFLKLHARCWGE